MEIQGSDNWITTVPEMQGREYLVSYCEIDDGYRRVVMQCAEDIWICPTYVQGYRLKNEVLRFIYQRSLERLIDSGMKDRAEAHDVRAWGQTVSCLKNVWKNASVALRGSPISKFVDGDFDRAADKLELLRIGKKRNKLLKVYKNCIYCGVILDHTNSTIEHVIPLSRGGGEGHLNQMLSCKDCNNRKGDELWEPIHVPPSVSRKPAFEQLIQKLRTLERHKPVQPRRRRSF